MADDDLLPKKKASSRPPSSLVASPPMLRIMRITRTLGILVGGFVTVVGLMATVGLALDNFWIRLLLALVVVIGLPAFVSDRLLKKTNLGGGLRAVADIFAIVLLGVAFVFVGIDLVAKPLFVREGDRYARSGSRGMARVTYFFAGVSPVFPEERSPAPPSGSASASASASGAPAK